MQRASAKLHGRTFQYILTVQDIFSRYIWLRPVTGKGSKQVAKELEELYSEVGQPKVLQCHNGGEFKKAAEHLHLWKTRSENNKLTVPSPIAGRSGTITPHVAQKNYV